MAASPPTPEALGAVIRALRQERSLTIEDLADRAGLHWTYLSEIERGIANPSLGKLSALASVFGVPVSEIIASAEEASASTEHGT